MQIWKEIKYAFEVAAFSVISRPSCAAGFGFAIGFAVGSWLF